MKQVELARWLKGIVLITGIIGLIACTFIVPSFGNDAVLENSELDYMFYPCLIFIWLSAIPFYIALWKAWGIFNEIAKDNSFSDENAMTLKSISKLALSEGLWYFVGLAILLILKLFHFGLFFIILLIIFAAIAIAVIAAALSHLVKKASDLKQENEYTI